MVRFSYLIALNFQQANRDRIYLYTFKTGPIVNSPAVTAAKIWFAYAYALIAM